MRPYTTDIMSFSLIMRSFKTSKVEFYQLDPTPGFGLATPMDIHGQISLLFRISMRLGCALKFTQKLTFFGEKRQKNEIFGCFMVAPLGARKF